jgi:hypothetical protein
VRHIGEVVGYSICELLVSKSALEKSAAIVAEQKAIQISHIDRFGTLKIASRFFPKFTVVINVAVNVRPRPLLELPRFGGHMVVLDPISCLPRFIDLTTQRGLTGQRLGRSSG